VCSSDTFNGRGYAIVAVHQCGDLLVADVSSTECEVAGAIRAIAIVRKATAQFQKVERVCGLSAMEVEMPHAGNWFYYMNHCAIVEVVAILHIPSNPTKYVTVSVHLQTQIMHADPTNLKHPQHSVI
jgi:hypothetical protein